MTNGAGFISPESEEGVEAQLEALTAQTFVMPPITRGVYVLDEDDLPDAQKELLHGRAYVIDRQEVTETDSGAPRTYYIAADQTQGLVVPGRTLFIKSELSDAFYRWTDDGDKWTDWITIYDGAGHSYISDEKCRFAEVQVFVDESDALLTLRATR